MHCFLNLPEGDKARGFVESGSVDLGVFDFLDSSFRLYLER